MTVEPEPLALPDVRTRAGEWAHALVAAPPWDEIASHITVLLTAPATPAWAETRTAAALIVLDGAEARALGERWRALLRDGVRHTPGSAAGLPTGTVAMTTDALARGLDGTSRRALELRWSIRHAQVIHDPFRRHEALVQAAGRVPDAALERIIRGLYVPAVAALRAVQASDLDPITIGEAAGAVARLACALESASHPPVEWLLPAVAETHVGQRLAAWFADLRSAIAGDTRASRWIRDAVDGVLRELAEAVRPSFAGSEWLADPESFALRPPR